MLNKFVFCLNYLLLLFVGVAFVTLLAGCYSTAEERANRANGSAELQLDRETGEATYSGEWEGTLGTHGFSMEYSGTWQFKVDFEEGEIEGRFRGDGAGDLTGTVSDGIVEASGEAAFGVVRWFGNFSSDGEEISGTWEITEVASEFGEGSGTWSGSLSELVKEAPEEEPGEVLPQEDQTDVDETLERYPGSVALNHESM